MTPNWKPSTYRNKAYREWMRRRPCVVCGFSPCDPHHEGSHGMGIKASDYEEFPLCHMHHRERHDIGAHAFAVGYGLDYQQLIIAELSAYIYEKEGR